MNYSPELKEALLRRMLPPNNESISNISKEEGISEQTLRNWRDKARADGIAAPGKDALPDCRLPAETDICAIFGGHLKT